MRIKTLSVQNFRQFKDRQTIEFPFSEQRNIVVIHGDNGAGKTSLLNAFKWALYGEVDFDTGDANLANDGALTEVSEGEKVRVEVRVELEDESRKYFVVRHQYFKRVEDSGERVGGSEINLSVLGDDNETRVVENPVATINQIMPENLQGYFFFNGERIEKLAYASRADDVKRAIKDVMGLTVIERAIKHLDYNVRKVLRKDVGGAKSKELIEVVNELDRVATAKHEKEEEIEELRKNIREADKELEDLNVVLRNSDKVSELQEQRDSKEDELGELREQEQHLWRRRKALISNKSFLAMGLSVFEQAGEIIEGERRSGHLPVKVRKPLIEDLLEQGQCICETPLKKGERPYEVVSELLHDVPDQELEDEFFALRSEAARAPSEVQGFFSDLREIEELADQISKGKKRVETEISEISAKIKSSDIEEVRKAERRRDELRDVRDHNSVQLAFSSRELSDLSKDNDELERKAENLRRAERSSVVSQQRMDALNLIVEKLRKRFDHHTQEVRERLSDMVGDVFSKIISKPYRAEISEDFTLEVSKPVQGGGYKRVEEKSTGENQVSSLSFIASIVAYSKKKAAEKKNNLDAGAIFPLVMDSPFGSLSPTYRRFIARYIPELADQIIILVSDSQWRYEVSEECSGRVAASYNLDVVKHGEDVISTISKE